MSLRGSDFLAHAGQHCDNLRAKYTVISRLLGRPAGRLASARFRYPLLQSVWGDWGFGVSSADPQNAVAAGGEKSLDWTRAVMISVIASKTEAAYTKKWLQYMMSRTRTTLLWHVAQCLKLRSS